MPEDTLKSHRVGSRKSELALIQTRFVISELEKLCPGHTFDVVEVSTIFLMRIFFYHHSDHLHRHFVNALGFLTCSLILSCTCTCITLLHMMIQSTFLLNFKLVALILTIPRCQRWETTSWTKLFRRSVKNLSSQKSSRWPWRLGRCLFQDHVVLVCLSIFVFVLFFFKELALKPSPLFFFIPAVYLRCRIQHTPFKKINTIK